MSIMPVADLLLFKTYILNAANSFRKGKINIRHDLIIWLLANQDDLQLPKNCLLDTKKFSDDFDNDDAINTNHNNKEKNISKAWTKWLKNLEGHINSCSPRPLTNYEESAKWLGEMCGLSDYEIASLVILTMNEKYKIVKELDSAYRDNLGGFCNNTYGLDDDNFALFAGMEGQDTDIQDLNITKFGFVENRRGFVKLTKKIKILLSSGVKDEAELKKLVFGKSQDAELTMSDFEYLGENIPLLKKIINSHDTTQKHPLNIFLYGAPGTGKTEFAKAIGKSCNHQVFFIGEHDEKNQDISRSERISSLMLLSMINDHEQNKLLVVDEADEILSDIGAGTNIRDKGSKIFLNRLLEKIKTPIIWIVNNHNNIDNAVLRRMSFSVKFPKPPLDVRKNIISKIAARNKANLGNEEINSLSLYDTSPAYLENAIRLGSTCGGYDHIKNILENNISVIGNIKKNITPKDDFKIELSNANTDLIALKDRVKACNSTKLTFCFSGVPGTGKSEYARHLAKEMGYEILYKRYSDLASMFVGGTEQNIAAAFHEASQKKAFLILDEADSLLMKRENAQKSWEVTQVNEFLTQIENHDYPFAITTNAFDNLDTAAMRRFLFKVKFDAMEREQIKAAFRHFFNKPAPNEILHTENLTPADFALVRDQAQILGIENPQDLAQMITEEAATRGGIKQRIGF